MSKFDIKDIEWWQVVLGVAIGFGIAYLFLGQNQGTIPISSCTSRTLTSSYTVPQGLNFNADMSQACFDTLKWQMSSGEQFVCGFSAYNPSNNQATCTCVIFPSSCHLGLPSKA